MSTTPQVRKRREDAYFLYLAGQSPEKIAQGMGVDSRTIRRDIEALELEWGEEIKKIAKEKYMGRLEHVAAVRFGKVYLQLIDSASSKKDIRECARILQEEEKRAIERLTKLGILPKDSVFELHNHQPARVNILITQPGDEEEVIDIDHKQIEGPEKQAN